jgi:hypothetical protein
MRQSSIEWLISEFEKQIQFRPDSELYIWFKELLPKAKAKHKEEMIAFAEFVAKYPDKNRNANNEMLHAKSKYDGAERTVDLLDEFYIQNFKEYATKQN